MGKNGRIGGGELLQQVNGAPRVSVEEPLDALKRDIALEGIVTAGEYDLAMREFTIDESVSVEDDSVVLVKCKPIPLNQFCAVVSFAHDHPIVWQFEKTQ
jgi:hypothetical protein